MKTFFLTYGQNATRVHPTFWEAVGVFCRHNKARLHVVKGYYKNPTSKAEESEMEHDNWWADEIEPYLTEERLQLGKHLKLFADVPTQPTASNPLTGFEGFLGTNFGVFGHPKRALKMVPSSTRRAKAMWTTGACTIANYSRSKAGKKGEHHHVIGGLVVEVDDDGVFFCRHVTATRDGSFTDLDTRYTPQGVQKAPPALSLTLGDYHSGREDEEVLEGTEGLHECVSPKHLVLHDLFDFSARNHHAKTHEERYDRRFDTVEAELDGVVGSLHRVAGWGDASHQVVVVRSNHDEAFERWLNDTRVPDYDPENEAYWCEVRARRKRKRTGPGKGWPDAFPMEARRKGAPDSVRYLRRNEPFVLAGVDGAFHGDLGPNGSRGSVLAFTRIGVKVTIGHGHAPAIADGCFMVGLTAQLDHGYNKLPSTWAHAHCVLHADGKRQMIFIINGRFRGGKKRA